MLLVMDSWAAIATLVSALIVLAFYHRRTRNAVSQIPGPKPSSFILGNLPELLQSQAGEADIKWMEQFGGVVRLSGALGETRLLITDPKAMKYICQTAERNFLKVPERRDITYILVGRGISYVEGHDHDRHRKIMNPAFGPNERKALLPIFHGCAAQLVAKWKDALSSSPDDSLIIDIPSWLSRATLDAIGQAAFNYQFGALADDHNKLTDAYLNMLPDVFAAPSKSAIFLRSLSHIIPHWLVGYMRKRSPRWDRLQHSNDIASEIATYLVDQKEEALLQGRGKRDAMSLLIKANAAESAAARLSREEMLAQMRTLMLAGHETTALTLDWALLEVARNPKMQDKLRKEIRSVESAMHARGDTEFSISDFEGMPYVFAFIKETMRLYPSVYHNERVPEKDDVLPLSEPIRTTSNQIIYEIPIPKGIRLTISIPAYNRRKDIFGHDSHTFRPDRWLDGSMPKKSVSVGLIGNLFTFSTGPRSCIGWRFALLEAQALLVALVDNFEFALTPEVARVRREACVMMVPMLEGEADKGAQLPLRVRPLER